MMKIGILAVQGAFVEHEAILKGLGVVCKEIRCKEDIEEPFDGLILPGGESTVQGKLLRELGLYEPMLGMINDGMPVLATCAGMILLAGKIEGQEQTYFATMPITVRRNAYGRQLGSFYTESAYDVLGNVPMTFIRAPFVTVAGAGTLVLASVDDRIVAVQYKNQIALSFHPELNDDTRIHENFIRLCRQQNI